MISSPPRRLFILIAISTALNVVCQNVKIDSLQNVLEDSKDTLRIAALNELAFEYWNYDADKAYNLAIESLKLSENLDYAKGKSWSHTNIGLYYYLQGDYNRALGAYEKAIEVLGSKAYENYPSYTYSRIGNLYRVQSQYQKALDYYRLSTSTAGINSSQSQASSYYNIGITFLEMSAFDSAKYNLRKSIQLRNKRQDSLYTSITFLELGRTFIEIGDLDSASYFLEKVDLINKAELLEVQIRYYIYSGELALLEGDFSEAIEKVKASLTLLNDYKFIELRVKSLYLLGSIYTEIGEYDDALDNLIKAEQINAPSENHKQEGLINYALGYVYYYQNNAQKAREEALEANNQFKKIQLPKQEAMTNNLLGLIELLDKKYEVSANYFDQAMETYRMQDYRKGIAAVLYNKSYIFLEQGQVEQVIQIQLEALAIEQEINNTTGIIISYNALGDLFTQTKEYKKAENYLLMANRLLSEHPSPSYEQENNLFLSRLYYSKNNFKRAYEYLLLSKQNSDSLFSKNSLDRSLQLSAIHDLEKKELEIQNLNNESIRNEIELNLKQTQLNQQRILTFISALAIIFFAILSYVLLRTIRKLKATQVSLIKAEKRASLSILIEGLGHEINNPLNFIKGGLEGLVLSQNKWSEDQLKLLDAIKEGTKRTTDIVGTLNKIQTKKETEFEKCDLFKLSSESIEEIKPEINKEVDIVIKRSDSQAITFGNSVEIKQLIYELLMNSVQSIKSKGKITLQIDSTTNYSLIIISDNGNGIAQKDLSLLENPFYTTKAPNVGKGLGLYLVDFTLHSHNGKIGFDSEVGKGTTVTVSLPKYKGKM